MASANPKTITLKGDPQGREALAAAAITPGMLLAVTAAGAVTPHATAGGPATAAFAREMDIAGGTIDDAYDAGDTVLYSEFRKGDMVYALLEDEASVAIGDTLQSNGAGALEPWVAGTAGTTLAGYAVARAMEAVDNTGGTGVVRIKVEVL